MYHLKKGEDHTLSCSRKGRQMDASAAKIRLMRVDDFNAVVRIDEKVLKVSRPEYYRVKFEELVQSTDRVPTSLVAEDDAGTVVGFVMGELFIGEYGLSEEATLDTIGVDPDYQQKGVGELLIREFIEHLKGLGVRRVNTLVDSNDTKLLGFFKANQFGPSRIVNLERGLSRR
jgi:ribosomal protein S18 acetylase RimI-like enzyme